MGSLLDNLRSARGVSRKVSRSGSKKSRVKRGSRTSVSGRTGERRR